MSATTPITGRSTTNPEALATWAIEQNCKRPEEVRAYLVSLHRFCAHMGLTFDILAAQSAHETADAKTGVPWSSHWWEQRLNPAGIGITGDPKQNDRSRVFANGEAAARAHALHMHLYVNGTMLPTGFLATDDPRWDAAVEAGMAGKVKTLEGLSGTWAADTGYSDKIKQWLARMPFGTTAPPKGHDAMARTIAMPPADRQIAVRKINGVGMDLLGPRTLRGICFHRALSGNQTLQVAADWLKNPSSRGLTDLFCDHRSGKMIRTNEITGTNRDMTGWAQGPYSSSGASADGRAFRNTFGSISGRGVHVINSDLESCEVTGNYGSPISDACKNTLVQWTASRAQQLGCTAESFPISPVTGLTVIYGHIEFCGKAHKRCPGEVVWASINGELIPRVRQLLADAADGVITPEVPSLPESEAPVDLWPYPDPVMPAFWSQLQAGAPFVLHNGTYWYPDNLTYVVKDSTRRQQYAVGDNRVVGPDLEVGATFRGAAKGQSDSDKQLYVITPTGTRVRMDALDVMLEDNAA